MNNVITNSLHTSNRHYVNGIYNVDKRSVKYIIQFKNIDKNLYFDSDRSLYNIKVICVTYLFRNYLKKSFHDGTFFNNISNQKFIEKYFRDHFYLFIKTKR